MLVELETQKFNFFRRLAIALSDFMRSFKNPTRELFEEKETEVLSRRSKLYNFILLHSKDDKDIRLKYSELYKEYAKIYKINLPKLAQRIKSKTTVEYAEYLDSTQKTNHLVNLYTLAVELYGDQASELRKIFNQSEGEA